MDTHARKYVQPAMEFGAKVFINKNISANQVTVIAFLTGMLSVFMIAVDKKLMALAFLWLSGYLDAIDGTIARNTNKSSSFGTMMDITFDRLVEIGIIIVLAARNPESVFNLLVLSSCIIVSMTVFLVVGALSEKEGVKSFRYQAGLAERSEGFIIFSLMVLFQGWTGIISNIFSVLIIITAVQRFFEGKKLLS